MKSNAWQSPPEPGLDRTLYLTEKKGLTVKRDGPSVWIKEDGSAGKRIPARLVNMVFVIGNIMLDTGVVTLFSENEVPMMFMNIKGEEVAVTSFPQVKRMEDINLQRPFLETTEGVARYRSWALSKRRKVSFLVRSFYAERKEGAFARAWRDVSEMHHTIAYARNEHPFVFRAAHNIIEGLVRELIIGVLAKARIDPHTGVLNADTQYGFVSDLCFVVGPEIEAQAVAFAFSARAEDLNVNTGRSCVPSKTGIKKLVEAFEGNKALLGGYVKEILGSYLRFAGKVQ